MKGGLETYNIPGQQVLCLSILLLGSAIGRVAVEEMVLVL